MPSTTTRCRDCSPSWRGPMRPCTPGARSRGIDGPPVALAAVCSGAAADRRHRGWAVVSRYCAAPPERGAGVELGEWEPDFAFSRMSRMSARTPALAAGSQAQSLPVSSQIMHPPLVQHQQISPSQPVEIVRPPLSFMQSNQSFTPIGGLLASTDVTIHVAAMAMQRRKRTIDGVLGFDSATSSRLQEEQSDRIPQSEDARQCRFPTQAPQRARTARRVEAQQVRGPAGRCGYDMLVLITRRSRSACAMPIRPRARARTGPPFSLP